MLTYGDGVADVNIRELVDFHRSHGKPATSTSAQPAGRFGALDLGEGFESLPQFRCLFSIAQINDSSIQHRG
jgi:glucose-1-phosphate cytidylyltransferase